MGACSNDPAEQYQKGLAYYHGEGVAVDKTKAVELFQKAAAQGFAL
ncbi:MAG: SEL1-like repeat protein, partial [Deltaproteobacteria bacterium]|nr:SEL1-like repeat protein [Deltaproteobacteria bacterium]